MPAPRTIIFDFETFYSKDYTLRGEKGLTYPEYVLDPRFKVHGLAVDDGRHQYWVAPKDIPATLKKYKADIIVCHNGYFDFGILAWHYKFVPAFMLDTLLLANHVLGSARDGKGSKNDLATLAQRFGIEAKGREIEDMIGVETLTEEQFEVLGIYAKKDVRITRAVLNRLLPLVRPQEFELWLLDHTLRIYVTKPLGVDLDKIAAARKAVGERRHALVKAAGVERELLRSDKQFAAELGRRLAAAGMKMPMKRAKPRKDGSTPMIPALAKDDAEFQELASSTAEPVAALVQARLAEKSATTVAARLDTMELYHRLGIGIPVHLVYYGAHTGRFSGGGGFNFQNLTSPGRAETDFAKEVAALVRQGLVPRTPGNVFVAVDAAQIEARILAWLAGEKVILEAFASGADIYSQFISDALQQDIHKPTAEDKKDPAKVQHLTLMRNAGKEAVLGLGFSMGVDKFGGQLKKRKDVRPHLCEDCILGPAVRQTIVDTYRETYTKIVALWAKLQDAFEASITGAVRKVGPLTFRRLDQITGNRDDAKSVTIELPSGRLLFYRNLRAAWEKTKFGKLRKVWRHGAGKGNRVYGGLITENVVQAIARDVLVEQGILAAEQAGYPVALSIHDEVVVEVPAAEGDNALKFLVTSLSTAPSWGRGLVLAAEGHVSKDLSK